MRCGPTSMRIRRRERESAEAQLVQLNGPGRRHRQPRHAVDARTQRPSSFGKTVGHGAQTSGAQICVWLDDDNRLIHFFGFRRIEQELEADLIAQRPVLAAASRTTRRIFTVASLTWLLEHELHLDTRRMGGSGTAHSRPAPRSRQGSPRCSVSVDTTDARHAPDAPRIAGAARR